ncbi:MAG: hypothetical protein AAF517_26180, partial [Planctomycetota bacterium]
TIRQRSDNDPTTIRQRKVVPMQIYRLFTALALVTLVSSCRSTPTGNARLVNPENVSDEAGSTEEIYSVSQGIVDAFLSCAAVSDGKKRIVLDRIVNSSGIRNYDEKVFYNRVLTQLVIKGGDRFAFLDRAAVAGERSLQAQGTVTPSGGGSGGALAKLVGADLTLTIEILSLPGTRTRTIQYNARLTQLDGTIACPYVQEFKKRL